MSNKVKIKNLSEKDIGRKVIFVHYPPNSRPNEEGIITSFNSKYVFVDYNNSGRGQATNPEYLYWVS